MHSSAKSLSLPDNVHTGLGSKLLISVSIRSSFVVSAAINSITFSFLKGKRRHKKISLNILCEEDTNNSQFTGRFNIKNDKYHNSDGHCSNCCTSHLLCMKNRRTAVIKQQKRRADYFLERMAFDQWWSSYSATLNTLIVLDKVFRGKRGIFG